MLLVITIVGCVLLGLLGVGTLAWLNLLPGWERERHRRSADGGLPQGCLLAIIVAATVWFIAWGVVLVLALRFLQAPLG